MQHLLRSHLKIKMTKQCFSKHYTPKNEIKHFNVLIDGSSFFFFLMSNKKQGRNIRKDY